MSRLLRALTSPRFMRDFVSYSTMAKAAGAPRPRLGRVRPILDEATSTTPFDRHYTYHPAWAARILAQTRPARHVDIASTLAFVAIASATTPIDHYDYRPAELDLPNVTCGSADLIALPFETNSIASLSCMHVVEHIGLGRYGDAIDPLGDRKAMAELARVLAPGGQLLFACPSGTPSIVFNAHRIYSHGQILSGFSGLELRHFSLITDKRNGGKLILDADPALVEKQRYGCGCYVFTKAQAR